MARSPVQWGSKKTLLAQLEQLWRRGLLLQELLTGHSIFPKRLVFKLPDSRALSGDFARVQDWVGEVNKLNGFRVVQRSVRHRVIGENQLPHEVWVDDLETAIALLGKEREVGLFSALLKQTEEQLPQLLAWIEQQPLKALALEKSWPKVLAFVQWRLQHPNPQIYLRQVNLTSPERKNSLVIFGSGYGFANLAQVRWLAHKPMVYWGDIDTHGFVILDQLRGKFPQVRSLLMDEQTLLAHQAFWGVEGKPERRALAHLTESEQSVYQQLLSNRHGQHVRLEQERIGFDYLLLVLAGFHSGQRPYSANSVANNFFNLYNASNACRGVSASGSICCSCPKVSLPAG